MSLRGKLLTHKDVVATEGKRTWPRSERGSEGTGQGLDRRITSPHNALPPRVAQAHVDIVVPVTAFVTSEHGAQPEPTSQVAE